MKFKFRLETVMRERKIRVELAQREYAEAQNAVLLQLDKIKLMYEKIEQTRLQVAKWQESGGRWAENLKQAEEFINGQLKLIEMARRKARDLMSAAEEKHEILVSSVQEHKIPEKLKERNLADFKKLKRNKENKEQLDIAIMKYGLKRE